LPKAIQFKKAPNGAFLYPNSICQNLQKNTEFFEFFYFVRIHKTLVAMAEGVAPTQDFVGMPNRAPFRDEAGYYTTLFHELVHSTGNEKRLNRSTLSESNGFGSAPLLQGGINR
jgi:hypothetical protein